MIRPSDIVIAGKVILLILFLVIALLMMTVLSPKGWAIDRTGRRRRVNARPRRRSPQRPEDHPASRAKPLDRKEEPSSEAVAGVSKTGLDGIPAEPDPPIHAFAQRTGYHGAITFWAGTVSLLILSAALLAALVLSLHFAFGDLASSALFIALLLLFVTEFAPLGRGFKWFALATPFALAAAWAISTGEFVPALALVLSGLALTAVMIFWSRTRRNASRARSQGHVLTEKTASRLGSPDPAFRRGDHQSPLDKARIAKAPDMYFNLPE